MRPMKLNLRLLLGACLAFFFLASCEDEPEIVKTPKRTVLVYIAADNNLAHFALDDMDEMKEGLLQVNGELKLLVYVDTGSSARLVELKKESRNVVENVVREYGDRNSTGTEETREVFRDVFSNPAFAAESYGLIYWSHADGWAPYGSTRQTRWIGQDTGDGDYRMNISDFVSILKEAPHFSFIMFDACFMGSVEVLYALRDKADYFVASPAEIITDGFPYQTAARYFWGGEEDLKQVCRAYYDYYANHPKGGNWCSGTLSLVKASELGALAQAARKAVGSAGEAGAGDVWRYPLIATMPNVFYDLGDYINVMGIEEDKAAFREQLARTVIYKVATPTFNSVEIPTGRYSGLSCYIPQSRWQTMNNYYSTLDWAQTVYGY